MLDQVPGQIHKRALPHVLNFLKRCEDETFDQVLASVGGDLVSLVTWIKVLIKVVQYEPGCSLQIAESIGPLVSCMCSDTDRLFFKSNKHWRDGGMTTFTWLIRNMIRKNMVPDANEENKDIIEALLQHDGLLTSIIQWSFWMDHRPDIVENLGSAACRFVATFGRSITRLLVHTISDATNNVFTKDKALLEDIGATPIASKQYDPTCMVSFVEGLVQQMKTNELDRSDLITFTALITIGVDCVDRGVITEAIDLGLNFATEFTRAFSLAFVLIHIMRQGSDTCTAFAIRAGLIGMTLCFVDRFGEHESFADESFRGMTSSLCSTIGHLLKGIHSISLHQKTSKANRSKSEGIKEDLVRLQQKTRLASNPECNELLGIVVSILYLNGRLCCRCNKSLSKTEVKQCNMAAMAWCIAQELVRKRIG